MDRKEFLESSGMCLGLSLVPGLAYSKNSFAKVKLAGNLNPKIIKDKEGDVLQVIGDIQTHKLGGSETGNQIAEWVGNVEPGVGIPPHIHTREDEIFRVVKGQIEIMVGDKTTILEAGDTAFAPKNIPHSWKAVGTEKVKMIVSAFPAGIEVMFRKLADLPPGPPDLQQVAEISKTHGITFV